MPSIQSATAAGCPSRIHEWHSPDQMRSPLPNHLLHGHNDCASLQSIPVVKLNGDVPPPVLVAPAFFSQRSDFIDQTDLDQQWKALKKTLRDGAICEQEAYAILSSGILQTPTGKAIAGLFADAMLRSIRPVGQLSEERLEEIVDVICHLPPAQWQAALGETVRFSPGQSTDSVTGFIQAQLERAGMQRDVRIANDELLADTQWEAVQHVTRQARQYIRHSSDNPLNSALMMLEDMRSLRPTPQEARQYLAQFIEQLDKPPPGERVRWPERFPKEVEAVYAQLKPAEESKQSWLEWIIGPSWLESLVGQPVSLSASIKGLRETLTSAAPIESVRQPLNRDRESSLLSQLQKFERSADFSTFTPAGPRIPTTLAESVVCALNVLSAVQPLLSMPNPPPHKLEGNQDLPVPPQDPGGEHLVDTAQIWPMWATLGLRAAQLDEFVTQFFNTVAPWNGANAQYVELAMDMPDDLRRVYEETTVPLDDAQSAVLATRMEHLGEQLHDWLNRMAVSLVSTGAAFLSHTGQLIENHPKVALGAFAAYMAISNFYAAWFLPEAQDPTRSSASSEFFYVSDSATQEREIILVELNDILDEFPDLVQALEKRLEQSTYVDPHLDFQLLEEIGAMLQQYTPSDPDITFLDRIDEVIGLVQADEPIEEEELPVTTSTAQTTEPNVLIRKKRSPERVSAFGVHWMVEVVRERKMAEIPSDQHGEEIAPGYTLDLLTDKVVKVLKDAAAITDPQTFIRDSVNAIISESSLPSSLKQTLDPASTVDVRFKKKPLQGKQSTKSSQPERIQKFSLYELCVDYHLRVKKADEEFTILWPENFPEDLINTIANADLQAAYKELITSTLERPDVKQLWKLSKEYELKAALESYKSSANATVEGIKIVDSFFEGYTRSHLVYLHNPRENSPAKVSNTLYLSGNLDETGLFVFLGGNNAVVELPAGSAQKRQLIETDTVLQTRLLDRIPLNQKLSREDTDFKYREPVSSIFDAYPLYAPVLFDTTSDAMNELYKRQLTQVQSDIDTLVSTDEERFTDGMLDALGKLLAALSIVTIVPGATVLATNGARMAASFLFGVSASATDLLRGETADDPGVAEQFRSSAYRGFIMEFAGPLAGRLIGKALSGGVASRIGRLVFNRIKSMTHRLPKPTQWIAPTVLDQQVLITKIQKKFNSHRTVSQLQTLGKGPEYAQKLIKDTKVIYFSGPREGYVYQGFVLRGDMRPPKVVFEGGFKLRTTITDVNQVNGMRGGFGGGKNALDPDGMGISTSPYYKHSGAGAYQYGGARGGYTYVIDARQLRGYHLYANDNWVKHPTSKLGMRPYEVNYGQSIPDSAVIGCYDKQGNFIANPMALEKSIERSKPVQFNGDNLFRPANSVFNRRFTTVSPNKPA